MLKIIKNKHHHLTNYRIKNYITHKILIDLSLFVIALIWSGVIVWAGAP
jgi:hypothetical protein